MKQFIFSIALISSVGGAMAQKTIFPEVKVRDQRNANPMQLQELSMDILVMGQTAVTTMEMTFYNPNDRVMEGEFEFPLSNGQEVSRFALDIGGKLREGVVVDKALGRQAFEDITRRNVDPGLLEKTEGNNFRARVYPMPAQGTRRILIAFEQELSQNDGRDFYFLPIASGVKLKHFRLRTEVVSRKVKADIENTLQLNFGQSRNSYISEVKKDNYTLDQNIGLTFPKIDKPQLLTASKGTDSYLYGNIALEKQSLREKEKPKRIGILWDCSSSSQKRDFAKEFALLDAYFKEIKEVKVALTTFHIRSSSAIPFKVENGNWQELRQYLEKLIYDGATDPQAMLFPQESDEYFLFSDGIFNFRDKNFDFTRLIGQLHAPVNVVSSQLVANMDKLQYLSGATGGSFINLNTQEVSEAVKALQYQAFQVLDYKVKKGNVVNLYPQKGTLVGENFTFSGYLNSEDATLVVSLGYPNKVIVEKELTFSKNTAVSDEEFALLRRIWAEKKIAQLRREGAESKAIDVVGRRYGIVTEGNSLIVLETAEDYVRYQITPPKELEQEYNKLSSEINSEKMEEQKQALERVISQSKEQTSWWQTSYPIKAQKKTKKNKKYGTPPPPPAMMVHAEEIAGYNNAAEMLRYDASDDNAKMADMGTAGYDIIADNSAQQMEMELAEPAAESLGYNPPQARIVLNAYDPDTPYLKVMEYTDPAKAIETYHKLKKEYGQTPSFYVDVADYFFKKGDTEQAILVVSNLAELSLEDAQLLRVLGYKLSSYKAYKEAIEVFRKVVAIREEEPQSYRDLGLALAEDKQYQEAVETLYKVVKNAWDERFGDVQLVTMNDINSLVARHKGIKTNFMDKRLLKSEPVDIRVVLSWDTDNCDMDLWVTDPTDEKCFFDNKLTYLGGKISKDVTQGYGPEEFMIKKAPKGTYKIETDYFGTLSQKQLMPVTLRITFYTHFGTDKEQKQETTVRLTNEEDLIEVGSFEFK
ncbi:VIT domain-containing protein [Capnocytophaga gingivalis]|uniref:VIT domain-containing protein n=1 Tax=Capnocytophaga gingivalis TaxID=1017 RepID=A0ABU5Z8E3_9FLAO|nr:VIT domain-containing protein [Capnocytophaga gingivalis]MEB3073746.1 VIT domain-containing protein [Capnocytophaga gingivalis]